MGQLIMLSIIFAMVIIPAYCAHRYSFAAGLKMTIIYMAIFTAFYFLLIIYVAPVFVF